MKRTDYLDGWLIFRLLPQCPTGHVHGFIRSLKTFYEHKQCPDIQILSHVAK
ncbi:hypothetical protein GRAN_0956 [Granulicella sibirica]|uniref:Uncharacterized protein n=1 Tax=Granulicella sibirica TaxID=2479048 RepID=A0A4Q0T7I3_9BACT|nr:hypothetical protein GRAN_0956 [Granulicella sibirica]